jgi:chloramphenicol 3-O phosphotransferase
MEKGKIIFLNGTSSSGKSTLAKVLQRKLPEPYFCIAMDTFTDIISPWFTGDYNGETSENLERQSLSAMHHTIKLYSDLGYNVIVDDVICKWVSSQGEEYKLLEECVALMHDYPVLFVKVYCPLEELKRREIERGDRDIGSAEGNYNLLYPKDDYDIVVDTFENSSEECANKIINLLEQTDCYKAFKKLYTKLSVINF